MPKPDVPPIFDDAVLSSVAKIAKKHRLDEASCLELFKSIPLNKRKSADAGIALEAKLVRLGVIVDDNEIKKPPPKPVKPAKQIVRSEARRSFHHVPRPSSFASPTAVTSQVGKNGQNSLQQGEFQQSQKKRTNRKDALTISRTLSLSPPRDDTAANLTEVSSGELVAAPPSSQPASSSSSASNKTEVTQKNNQVKIDAIISRSKTESDLTEALNGGNTDNQKSIGQKENRNRATLQSLIELNAIIADAKIISENNGEGAETGLQPSSSNNSTSKSLTFTLEQIDLLSKMYIDYELPETPTDGHVKNEPVVEPEDVSKTSQPIASSPQSEPSAEDVEAKKLADEFIKLVRDDFTEAELIAFNAAHDALELKNKRKEDYDKSKDNYSRPRRAKKVVIRSVSPSDCKSPPKRRTKNEPLVYPSYGQYYESDSNDSLDFNGPICPLEKRKHPIGMRFMRSAPKYIRKAAELLLQEERRLGAYPISKK